MSLSHKKQSMHHKIDQCNIVYGEKMDVIAYQPQQIQSICNYFRCNKKGDHAHKLTTIFQFSQCLHKDRWIEIQASSSHGDIMIWRDFYLSSDEYVH